MSKGLEDYDRGTRIKRIDFSWVEESRKEFLLLVKNLPKIDTYEKALEFQKIVKVYRAQFHEFFFEDFLNNEFVYRFQDALLESNAKALEKKLRILGWNFYVSLELHLPQQEYADSLDQLFKAWDKKARKAAQDLWKFLKYAIELYRNQSQNKEEGLPVRVPIRDQVVLEGFRTTLQGFGEDDEHDQEALARLREALRLYKKRASSTLPILLKYQLPLLVDFKAKLDVGGRYLGDKILISASADWTDQQAQGMAHMLAHEMSHHLFKMLATSAKDFWNTAIHGDIATLDISDLLANWPPSIKWASDLVSSLASKDPILALQVDVLTFGHRSSKALHTREDYEEEIAAGRTTINVPKTPITGYAGKNAEESFCEAVGRLVTYGPMAVHPLIQHWLGIVLPGEIKTASLVERVAIRFADR